MKDEDEFFADELLMGGEYGACTKKRKGSNSELLPFAKFLGPT
jgi:hypothetical protein